MASRTEAELRAAIREAGFTPGRRDIPGILALLADADEDVATAAERALARAEPASIPRILDAFDDARPPARARVCATVGRIAARAPTSELLAWLGERLRDDDRLTRRRAATALGRVGAREAEPELRSALLAAADPTERRVITEALGKVGSLGALEVLGDAEDETARIARARIERDALRATPTTIDLHAAPRRPTTVLLHARAGLEPLLERALSRAGFATRTPARGRVAIDLDRPLVDVMVARTFVDLGFPLPPESIEPEGGVVAAVVRALTGAAAVDTFTTFTRGPIRWRLEWADAGHRRAATTAVAAAVAACRPELVNDPRDAAWEVVVSERGTGAKARAWVELWPRALQDPRFSWRVRTLPAASHPTLSAALAEVAGVRDDDVVWDPFVGAAGELVERGLAGPWKRAWGTDTDPHALAAGRENLAAAGVAAWELVVADARTWRPPEPISLVVTNPPFGRRVRGGGDPRALLRDALANAASVMTRGGRLVWISPWPDRTVVDAHALGLEPRERIRLDMGGLPAELQRFEPVRRSRSR